MGGLAFGLLGVGAYGPSFLGDYAKFLKDVASLQGADQEKGYETLVSDMGSGKMPAEYRGLATALMLQHPTKNLEAAVELHLKNASTEGGAALQHLKDELKRKGDTAELASRAATAAPPAVGGAPPAEPLKALDTGSLLLLKQKSPSELQKLKIDPAALNALIELRQRAMPGPH